MTKSFISFASWLGSLLIMAVSLLTNAVIANEPAETLAKDALVMVVMDPMAAPLACDCVQGLAQRKYEKLAEYLEPHLKQKIVVVWSESLVTAMKDKSDGRADIIVGKDSVVRSDSKRGKISVTPLDSLTDMKGSTKQKGLFVVRASSPASSLLDIEDHQSFGKLQASQPRMQRHSLLVGTVVRKLLLMILNHLAAGTSRTARDYGMSNQKSPMTLTSHHLSCSEELWSLPARTMALAAMK